MKTARALVSAAVVSLGVGPRFADAALSCEVIRGDFQAALATIVGAVGHTGLQCGASQYSLGAGFRMSDTVPAAWTLHPHYDWYASLPQNYELSLLSSFVRFTAFGPTGQWASGLNTSLVCCHATP